MDSPGHPFAAGPQHPWLDPFSPPDVFNPRPDQELALLGGLAPSPESFPFTEAGRQDYYAAVRAAERQFQMTQHMQIDQMGAQAAAEAELTRAASEAQDLNLLLLL